MNKTPKAKTTYSLVQLDGETVTFTSTLDLAWAVVVEDSADRAWNPSRFGIYFKSASRPAADKKALEARGITGEYRFAKVAVVPLTRVS